jgi:photosystem II stability/assembly factor-like uncharacterized protein
MDEMSRVKAVCFVHPVLNSTSSMKSAKFFLVLFLFFICSQTAKADWVKRESNSLAWFYDVYFLSENKGWIAGSGGTLLVTIDGGKTWKKEKDFTSDTIRGVYFTDENNGWLLCERDIYSLGSSAPSYLLKTSDGGAHWERIEFGDDKRKRIAKVFFNEKGSGAAIGEGGVYFALDDNKKTWKKMPSTVRYLMLDGIFTDDSHGAMVGAGGTILFTEDAGLSWNKSSVFGNSKAKLNSVFFINQKTGWTVGTQGKIYQTFNGGKVWREQNSNTVKDLTDVFFCNTAEGWAVGEEGLILHTTTAGNIWKITEPKVKHKLEKVFFTGKKGWAVGFGGTILSYTERNAKNIESSTAPKLKTRN